MENRPDHDIELIEIINFQNSGRNAYQKIFAKHIKDNISGFYEVCFYLEIHLRSNYHRCDEEHDRVKQDSIQHTKAESSSANSTAQRRISSPITPQTQKFKIPKGSAQFYIFPN